MARQRLLWLLVLSLATGVTGSALAQHQGQGDHDDDDDDGNRADRREDRNEDRDARQNVRQLKQITASLTHQDERLAKVLGHIGPPDAPVPAELRAALLRVGVAAQAIVNRANPYLGQNTPPPPPPPATPPGSGDNLTRQQRRDLRRLESIAGRLADEDERLARVLGHIGPPDAPIPTEIRTEITNVRAAGQTITGHVAPYLGGGTVPPPPTDGGGPAVPPPPTGGSGSPPPPNP